MLKIILLFTIIFLLTSSHLSESDIRVTKDIIKKDSVEKIDTNIFLNALFIVESEKNDSAYCKQEEAVGVLQIRPIMVEEVNRILGYNKYKLSDRWSRGKSIEIFWIYTKFYMQHYNESKISFEKASRRWNGGPNGHNMKSTQRYWNEVKTYM